jgi:hypothetical protein
MPSFYDPETFMDEILGPRLRPGGLYRCGIVGASERESLTDVQGSKQSSRGTEIRGLKI